MDRQIYDRLAAWLNAHYDDLVADLMDLVAIPSVSVQDDTGTPYGQGCQDVLHRMLALAEGCGFTTDNAEDRYGMLTLRNRDENIAIWTHLDVVPPGEGWLLTDPFVPVIREGFLIGRGADDNKAPAVGVMYMLRALEELNLPTRHGLRLYVGCDEENGMSDVQHFAMHRPPDKLSIIADCGFPVCYGEKGIMTAEIVSAAPVQGILSIQGGIASNIVPAKAEMRLRGCAAPMSAENLQVTCTPEETHLSATGKSGHSAFPQGTVNALHGLMAAALETGLLHGNSEQALSFMKHINDDWLGTALGIATEDEVSGPTTCVGTMATLRPDGRLALHLNIRYCISAKSANLIAHMEAACREHGCTLEVLSDSAPSYFPREHPVVDALTDLCTEFTGKPMAPYVMGGGTYARGLPNSLGFGLGGLGHPKSDMFVPGHGGAHQPDEARHLESFKDALILFAMGLLEADRVL